MTDGAFIFYFLTPPNNLHARSVGRRIARLSWKTVTGATGYQIRYGTDKSFKSSKRITIKSRKTLQKVIRRLQKKTNYFQIRAIKKNGNSNFCSAWSKTVSCPVK